MSDLRHLPTGWFKEADKSCPHAEYPRPQLKRGNWRCLNGPWQYIINDGSWPEKFSGEIIVPFSPESLLSGVGVQLKPGQALWYQREFSIEAIRGDNRLLLNFGAVDQRSEVFVNGKKVGSHEGGYWPFSFDVTEYVCAGENILTVCVWDDSDQGLQAYGKQKLKRGGIWYTAQSGIWQTVWMETVPRQHLERIRITPYCESAEVEIALEFSQPDAVPVTVRVFDDGDLLTENEFDTHTFKIPMEGFRYWSPQDPFLYTAEIRAGEDVVETYFGMRQFGTIKDSDGHPRLSLNGSPIFHTGLLDQGYWSDGMYTSPSDEAMVWELTEIKKLGFNMLRKHIKIEPLRWYYHCDRLGILVWQDFVNGGGPYTEMVTRYLPFVGIHLRDRPGRGGFGRHSDKGRDIFERDMKRTVDLLYNVVSLCVWVPFNEGWGQYKAVQITDLLRKLDHTRQIDHASGWHDQKHGDFDSIHVYYKPFRLKPDKQKRVQALTEFGGYSCPSRGHMASDKLFGYRMYKDPKEFTRAFERLYRKEVIPAVKKGLSAAIYTQVSDIEDEINGLFTYDRKVLKIDAAVVRDINKEFVAPPRLA